MTTLAASSPSVTSSTSSTSSTSDASKLRIQALVAAVILAAFTAWSLWIVRDESPIGFLTLAGREPWALQVLVDLVLAAAIAFGWVRADARKRGIAAWPYLVITLFLGSIGLLAYIVRRGLGPTPRPAA